MSQDFDITLEFVRLRSGEDPFAFDFGARDYIVVTDTGEVVTLEIDWARACDEIHAWRSSGGDGEAAARLGNTLRVFLGGEICADVKRAVEAAHEGLRTRLTIQSAAAEIYALPWGLLTPKASGQAIGSIPGLLVRYRWPGLGHPSQAPPRGPNRGRVLVAWSASGGSVPIAEHIDALEHAAEGRPMDFDRRCDVIDHASFRAIDRALRAASETRPYEALHLLCHGGRIRSSIGLVLDADDSDGSSATIDGSRFQHLLLPHRDTLRTVLVFACEGGDANEPGYQLGSIAQRIHRAGIESVIASRFSLRPDASTRFARVFHSTRLRERLSVEEAFLAARGELLREAVGDDWAGMQIYSHRRAQSGSAPVELDGPEATLAELLAELFDPDALRHFLRTRPSLRVICEGEHLAGRDLSRTVVRRLRRHRLIDIDLLEALADERPRRARDIQRVAKRLGLHLRERTPAHEMPALERFQRSIGLLRVDEDLGATAWLVAEDRVFTCLTGLESGGHGEPMVFELPDHRPIGATVVRRDRRGESALLALDQRVTDRPALPIAAGVSGRASAWSIGYTRARAGWAVPLDGLLTLPNEQGESFSIYSERLALQLDSPHHCLAGAPVIVDDHVVGMITRQPRSDTTHARSLSQLVCALRGDALLAVLERRGEHPIIGVKASRRAPQDAEDVEVGISYAATDLEWARVLAERLTMEGFNAQFVEPFPGDAQDGHVEAGLRRCGAAIVLLSGAWLDSRACGVIGDLLLLRRAADKEFRLIVARLDNTELDGPWRSCHHEDFRGERGPAGPRWDALVHALRWREPLSTNTSTGLKEFSETSATDTMITDLWAAAQIGPVEVVELWRGWRSAGALDLAPSLQVSEYLIAQSRADLALEILATVRRSARAEQLRALALARTGRNDDALLILERLKRSGQLDSETTGLLAGCYKRVWEKTGQARWLQKSFDHYDDAYRRFGETYTGINVAALALYLGRRDLCDRRARDVIAALEALPERDLDHWKLATMAEAWLLRGDLARARRWYDEAIKRCPEFHSDVATMRAQATRNLRHLQIPEDTLSEVFVIPRVVAFVGHMEDGSDRPTPRFPAHLVPRVRDSIRTRLRDENAGFGFSSLARGADILFVEEMMRRRAHVRVLLPFPADAFARTSVGPRWEARFRALLDEPRVQVSVLAEAAPAPDRMSIAFDVCTQEIFQRAEAYANQLHEEPLLLAVWDGNPGDGRGGTADAVAFWRQSGHPIELIDLSEAGAHLREVPK